MTFQILPDHGAHSGTVPDNISEHHVPIIPWSPMTRGLRIYRAVAIPAIRQVETVIHRQVPLAAFCEAADPRQLTLIEEPDVRQDGALLHRVMIQKRMIKQDSKMARTARKRVFYR